MSGRRPLIKVYFPITTGLLISAAISSAHQPVSRTLQLQEADDGPRVDLSPSHDHENRGCRKGDFFAREREGLDGQPDACPR
jgi:hypothetical protein